MLGFIELSSNNPAGALRHLEAALHRWQGTGVREPGMFQFPPDLAEALILVGRLGEAEDVIRTFEEMSRAVDRAWGLATSSRCRALLAGARGDLPGAVEHVGSALEVHSRLQMPFELARTHLAQGQILRRAKQKRAARGALEGAATAFERLGSPLWAERARAELGRIGGRVTSVTELTPTERRVAEAVAAGKSNREAAAALFMSVHTVEDNLTRAYRKLQVRSRTELARKLAAEGPDDRA